MLVKVKWFDVGHHTELWSAQRVLYAYLDPDGEEILYIGKAYGRTVRERWRRSAKPALWDFFEQERGLYEHSVRVGVLELEAGARMSQALVSDVESLLIHRLQPAANIQCLRSRIVRPGLVVRCSGQWPLRQKNFVDG
jgi:hypothetical protein